MNKKDMEFYEKSGDNLFAKHARRKALMAFSHAQNACMTPPMTQTTLLNWSRIQKKIMACLEEMALADSKKGRGTSELKKRTSRENGRKSKGRPPVSKIKKEESK